MSDTVSTTLAQRGSTHGKFADGAALTQTFKTIMRRAKNWERLDPDQREALEMIAHKISRVLVGDPNFPDSWHDISGYAKLVDDRLVKLQLQLESVKAKGP